MNETIDIPIRNFTFFIGIKCASRIFLKIEIELSFLISN
jgi:hypothetical protein